MQRHTEYAEQHRAIDHEAMRKGIHLVWSGQRRGYEGAGPGKLEVARVAPGPMQAEIPIEPVTRAGQLLLRWMRMLMAPANRYSEA